MSLAVFDLGKTNSKLFVFSAAGEALYEARTKPVWADHDGKSVLDERHLFAWMQQTLSVAADAFDITGVMFSGHGCTFALVDEDGLTHPILDYEQEPPADISRRIDAEIPAFADTFSPKLPLGFNYGRHLLWLADTQSDAVDRARWVLSYPQFWSWRFSEEARSEVSYLGCHSHLWAPLDHGFSSLVKRRGWLDKMPPFARAGDRIGSYMLKTPRGQRAIAVHNGVHDSNAALSLYRALGLKDFTLISSGTWVIIFNTTCPLQVLDERRDMLANVSVDGDPVATIRFMGGREYDVVSHNWTAPITAAALRSVIEKSIFALPSFAAGGPFQGAVGSIVGPAPTPEERAALAVLYVALMTDQSLDLIRSNNDIVIDGGLVKNGLYAPLLAQLRPDQRVMVSREVEGSALGAAALALETFDAQAAAGVPTAVETLSVEGLENYRRHWRDRIAIQAAEAVA